MAARWYNPGTGQFDNRDSYDLDPRCQPDDEQHAMLQSVVEWAAELVTSSSGFTGINDQISPAQWNAIKEGSGFATDQGEGHPRCSCRHRRLNTTR